MGAWGPAIFSDDVACDVRDSYRELLEDQLDDSEAEARVLQDFAGARNDPDDGPVVWLALAATSSKLGRLSDETRDRALAIIDDGGDSPSWSEADPNGQRKRTAALVKLREQLVGDQPPRKTVRRPKQRRTGLTVGDVLGYHHRGRIALVRVATMSEDRQFESPVLSILDHLEPEVPSAGKLESIPDRIATTWLASGGATMWEHQTAVVVPTTKDAHGDAGFEIVGRVGPRPGDDELHHPVYVGFFGLADLVARAVDRALDGPG